MLFELTSHAVQAGKKSSVDQELNRHGESVVYLRGDKLLLLGKQQ